MKDSESEGAASETRVLLIRAVDIASKDLAENGQPGGQFFGIHASNGERMIFADGIPIRTRGNVALAPTDGKGQVDAVEVHSPSSPAAAAAAWGGALRLLSGSRILPLRLLLSRC
jgi:hypothetical protein